MSNLQLRVLSALVLAVAVLALTWAGGLPFRLLAIVISAAIFYEWTLMTRAVASLRQRVVAALLLAVILVALAANMSALVLFGGLGLAVAICAVQAMIEGQGLQTAIGLAYAALAAIALALLRNDDGAGLLALLYLFAIVWTTDILAYFVGRAVGGPKLAPMISPGKTWSGALGGAVGGTVAGALVMVADARSGVTIILIALVLSIVSQIGDLLESALKRRHGAKDSSNLIPGHGGVMDRVDGLVAAAFALYLIGAASGTVDQPAHGLFSL